MGLSNCNGNGKNGKRYNKHHIIPRSRGGGEIQDNIVKLPSFFHDAYHMLFSNLTPNEAIDFLERVFIGKGFKKRKKNWTQANLYELQLKIQQETIKKEKRKLREKA